MKPLVSMTIRPVQITTTAYGEMGLKRYKGVCRSISRVWTRALMNMACGRKLFVLLVTLGVGCGGGGEYRGDGDLTDNGVLAASERFVLRMDGWSATERVERTYEIVGLVRERFVVGFELRGQAAENQCRKDTEEIRAKMELRRSDGGVVFREEGSLGGWAWSEKVTEDKVFVYSEQTYFDASRSDSYELEVRWHGPELRRCRDLDGVKVTVVAKGGGWK